METTNEAKKEAPVYANNGEAYKEDHRAIVEEYLKAGAPAEFSANGVECKTLHRSMMTGFYDVNGDTLFSVVNERLEAEKADMQVIDGGISNEVVEQETEESGQKVESEEGTQKMDETREDGSGEPEEIRGGIDEAIAKLQSELNGAKDKSFAEPVITHLIERVKDSESLAKDVLHKAKTWDKCYQYIYSQARKQIKGSSGAVRDSVVYEWAEDYFHKDEKELSKDSAVQKAVATAVAGPKKAESKAKSAETKKPETKKKTEPKKDESPKAATVEEKPKPKKNAIDGQMDLFSMLGM